MPWTGIITTTRHYCYKRSLLKNRLFITVRKFSSNSTSCSKGNSNNFLHTIPAYNKHFINGEWIQSSALSSTSSSDNIDSNYLTVTNSNDGQPVANFINGTYDDVQKGVDAATQAFDVWSQQYALNDRMECIKLLLEQYERRREDVAHELTKELGAPYKLAYNIQAGMFTYHTKEYLKIVDEYKWKEDIGRNTLIIKEPIGIVAAITPWNWPLNQIAVKVIPALLSGCTVILKPSEVTPINAKILSECFDEITNNSNTNNIISPPKGIFNCIFGDGNVGEMIASHPSVDMISFTGSTNVGKRLHEVGAKSIKRVRTELGGKSSTIVLKDATVSQIQKTAKSMLLNSGQSCDALSRMICPASRQDEIINIVKDVFENDVNVIDAVATDINASKRGDIGPLSSQKQYEHVRKYIQKGIDENATLVTGGLDHPSSSSCSLSNNSDLNPNGYFIRPTLFANVTNDMTIAQEEIFGPVLCIIPYDDENNDEDKNSNKSDDDGVEEAIAIANDTIYGLSNCVIGGENFDRCMYVASKLRSGTVHVNTTNSTSSIHSPFGGYKQSGDGREQGVYGLEEFLEIKCVNYMPTSSTPSSSTSKTNIR